MFLRGGGEKKWAGQGEGQTPQAWIPTLSGFHTLSTLTLSLASTDSSHCMKFPATAAKGFQV